MSKRVATEMNLTEKEVSYLIRFDGNCTDKTKIKFITDGVLLKEIETDFLLKKYSVVILDEAHERSSYTDILIGLLSRIVPLRNKQNIPLKLIIMSATLRVSDFTGNSKLFKMAPPVINVETRQYPVTIHFQKNTPKDYISEAFKKTVQFHSKLPEGAVLIFLTGQKEVKFLVNKLKKKFPIRSGVKYDTKKEDNDTDNDDFDIKKALKTVKKAKKAFAKNLCLPKINLDNYQLPADDTIPDLFDNDMETELDSDDCSVNEENLNDDNNHVDNVVTSKPLWVLPLYSLLSTEKQNRVFQPPPEGCRLCIVSTNIAETSLTIPNVKYVIDCGREKSRLYDKITGISSYVITLISKASADQRSDRAGRTSAGHCYRLYSSAVYNNEFEQFSIPDIQKKPVDDLILQMKYMGIDRVINFPFPSPPNLNQLKNAENFLTTLGAVEKSDNYNGKITKLGKAISAFPVAPKFGKMLALSHQHNLLQYTVAIVSALSVPEILVHSSDEYFKEFKQIRNSWTKTGNYKSLGDALILLKVVGAAEYANSLNKMDKFCEENGVRKKGIYEVRKLRIQLTNEINLNLIKLD